MKLNQILLFLFYSEWVFSASLASITNEKSWGSYMRCLSYFQKFVPGSYPPPELIRFDRLPIEELTSQVNKYSDLWLKAFKTGNSNTESHQRKLSVSKEANWTLYLLLQKSQDQAPVYGSRADLLEKFPSDARIAMTPLDSIFKLNTFSKGLNAVLLKGGIQSWNAFSYNPNDRSMQLEIVRGLEQSRISFPVATIQLKTNSDLSNVFKVRTPASQNAVPDLRVDPTYLQGNFFNPQNKEYTPFGKYIKESDTFIDEKGQQHFGGDGHNHSHSH